MDQQGRAESTVTMRASNMFCYDPVVFLYMLVLAGGAVMSILGSTWVKSECSGSNATVVTSFFWIYVFGGGVVIMLSLCVECGRSQVSCLPSARLHAHRGARHARAARKMLTRVRASAPLYVGADTSDDVSRRAGCPHASCSAACEEM